MKTPICDYVEAYAAKDCARFHMPGHKGTSFLGCEALDITEILGADELYHAHGIILESENNASRLFDTAHSFYSTEGSSLCIRAMLAAVTERHRQPDRQPLILAARNVHKAFLSACALLDLRVEWLLPTTTDHLCKCTVTKEALQHALSALDELPSALYLTSPDYLGSCANIKELAEVCHAAGVPLLVDNAHGAYLHFLSPSRHPIALGADLCCDSAHKTLPVLTGGAYLHVSKAADKAFLSSVRQNLELFASSSPSYLILQSLDLCNRYLSNGYAEKLSACVARVEMIKASLASLGFVCDVTEPLKIVLHAASFGYTGDEIASHLRTNGIEAEFSDRSYLVLMASPETREVDYARLIDAFSTLSPRTPIPDSPPSWEAPARVRSIREATLSPSENIPVEMALGRVCASPSVSCPPAVPIAVSGEVISEKIQKILFYYNQTSIEVCL